MNTAEIIKQINEKTAAFKGMDVPVKVIVNTETKKFTIEVGTPPVSAMIKKEMNVQKLAVVKEGNKTLPGDISFDKVVNIAKNKEMSGGLKARVNQVLGTCLSGGVTVDGKSPRDVIKEVKEGKRKVE